MPYRLSALLWGVLLLASTCGQIRPLPPERPLADYTPLDLAQLRENALGLRAGQLVQVRGYFWEFLSYDPVPQHYYLNQLRYPATWHQLEWFALYEQAAMRGYFDQAVMSAAQRQQFQPRRLEQLIIYGELVPLSRGRLYLQTHHLERVVLD